MSVTKYALVFHFLIGDEFDHHNNGYATNVSPRQLGIKRQNQSTGAGYNYLRDFR